MKRVTIPSILGILLLAVGLFNGIILVQNRQFINAEAASDFVPKSVQTSNVGDDSFTITWITNDESSGFVVWGSEADALKQISSETVDKQKNHLVTIDGLKPLTTYYFKINSGGEVFDNAQIAWEETTGPRLNTEVNQGFISGVVTTELGLPVKNVLVFATPSGGSTLSTKTTEDGHFTIALLDARVRSLVESMEFKPKSIIELTIQSGVSYTSFAKINYESAAAVPAISLGNTYDFTSISPAPQVPVPDAEIIVPENL